MNQRKRFEIVVYVAGERRIFWPAEWRPDVLADKLRAAKYQGLAPRLVSVG